MQNKQNMRNKQNMSNRGGQTDTQYQTLLKTVVSGFPQSKTDQDPVIHAFWPVQDPRSMLRPSFRGRRAPLEI